MPRISLLSGLFLLLLSLPAAAAPGGFYVGISGGASLPDEARNDSNQGSFNYDFEPGYLGAVTVGYDLRENFPDIGAGRIELEAAYRRNTVEEAEYVEGTLEADGKITVASLMLNTFGETRAVRPWIPYIGAGIGVARLELDDVRFGPTLLAHGKDTVFAWQVGAGIGLEVGHYLILDLGYRYFSAVDPKFKDAQGRRFESEFRDHQVLLGIRLDF